MIEKDQSLQQLIETTKQQIKQTYSICFFNLVVLVNKYDIQIWIVVQNLFVGIYWKRKYKTIIITYIKSKIKGKKGDK